ncbi:hypothetical protein PCNPT3_07070 [Psychromonas sp. CNPT3]|uniref:hypothetical protein n=1 Tax=Psychromonas sp. CNPT3 TaxID=314282 RepID=UPI00006E3C11|nr:hypothetical protein [Psychromonas sp. CNPT3]AGH81352.1 hypothetical protein PCNPT3_07070 [Psychromonas sp. CNPT3]
MIKHLISLIILATITGCVNTLDDLNSGLASINTTLNNTTLNNTTLNNTTNNNVKKLSPSELDRLDNLLLVSSKNDAVRSAINEAKVNIKAAISLDACSASRNKMTKYAAPGSMIKYYRPPMSSMRYHNSDANQCLNVVRVQGMKMLAKNAMAFEVTYESKISDEVATMKYRMLKQPSGEWLFE